MIWYHTFLQSFDIIVDNFLKNLCIQILNSGNHGNEIQKTAPRCSPWSSKHNKLWTAQRLRCPSVGREASLSISGVVQNNSVEYTLCFYWIKVVFPVFSEITKSDRCYIFIDIIKNVLVSLNRFCFKQYFLRMLLVFGWLWETPCLIVCDFRMLFVLSNKNVHRCLSSTVCQFCGMDET